MASTTWDFDNIGNGISYFHQPEQKNSQNGPSLVVLCTWMSAARKHISKYTQQYRQQYPNADILVVESGVAEMVYRTNASQQKWLQPARDVLLSHTSQHAQGRGQRQAVLHIFSNGGSQCAIQLATSLPEPIRHHAFSAIILDSCPGTATYQRTVQALTLSMPKSPLTKYLGPLIIHFVLCLLYLALFLTRAEDAITRIRNQLNDHKLFSSEVPRLYIYSKADRLVPYQDVKSHAGDAKVKGYRATSEVLFEDSAHCAHAMAHKEEYWEAVAGLLEAGDLEAPN
jgi:pimeloyl-ACP methyl ester carboxylesterase